MLKLLDKLIDNVTMYRLLIYYLLGLLLLAAILGGFSVVSYSPVAIALCASYLVVICWLTHFIFSRVFGVAANFESTLITALILALIITPLATSDNLVFLTAAGGLAISSKYILAWRKVHIFNPAAIAVVLTALGAGQTASWWVGTTELLPFVLLGGLVIARKVQREAMVFGFFAVALVSVCLFSYLGHNDILGALQKTLVHSSFFFMGFVMLTEPLTSPSTRFKQFWYGVFAGVIFPPQVHIGSLYSTPELVLATSNILSFIISPKRKVKLEIAQKIQQSEDKYDFIFSSDLPIKYKPGQYMEFTLPHSDADSRGIRRYFSIASSPTEDYLRIGVKFYDPGSSYKAALKNADKTSIITAGQLAGDFVLPSDNKRKLAFIAGGIGVTPFRSMVKYMVDDDDARDFALFYSEKSAQEFCYREVFDAAKNKFGATILYSITNDEGSVPAWAYSGGITSELIARTLPDYKERLFYISGPYVMVQQIRENLRHIGVSKRNIKVDFFPGYKE